MADKIFTIDNPANPIRLVNIKPKKIGKYYYQGFDDNLSAELIPNFQSHKCYYQKFTNDDAPKLQVLSDYTNIFCKLYDIYTGLEVDSFTFQEINVSILNQTFKCYEVKIDFGFIDIGEYQLVIYYYDTDPMNLVYYYSEPIQIKEVHENTVRIEYTNSINDFSMLFDNQFTGILRVEAAIINFKPGSDDVIYNDQEKNSTTINSVPFRQFHFFLGDSEGLPDWMIDKVNRSFSFDILSLDGVFYNKLEGAKFEENRAELYPYSGQVIDIIPVDNRFQEKINTDGLIPNNENMIQYQKVLKYLANGANILINNKFKNGTLLEKICIINRDIDFNLRVFTTETGSDDDLDLTFDVNGITATILINQLFHENKTLNLTGLNDIDCDVYILYKDLLAIESGTPNAYFSLGKGAICLYREVEQGDLEIDFNLATGLGRFETQWEGWEIDYEMAGVVPIGLSLDGDYSIIGENFGSDKIKITEAQLPKVNLGPFKESKLGLDFGSGSTRSSWTASSDKTLSFGADEYIDIRQASKVVMWVRKIVE